MHVVLGDSAYHLVHIKVYFNWQTNKAEKCTMCFPRIEAGMPTICSETCVGRIRYIG